MVYYLYHSLPNVNLKQNLWIETPKFGEKFPSKQQNKTFSWKIPKEYLQW